MMYWSGLTVVLLLAINSKTTSGQDPNAQLINQALASQPRWPVQPVPLDCQNFYDNCAAWAAAGECGSNPTFMELYCRSACQKCGVKLSQADQNYYKPNGAPAYPTKSPIPDLNSLIGSQPNSR